jgi:hypothetical protein
MLHRAPNTTIPNAAATARATDVDTTITVLFGTISLILGTLQVIFSWQSARALRQRNARP